MGWLKHAFAIDPPGPAEPNEDEARVLDRLARLVVRRGLTAPALFFLECSHPLNFVASSLMVALLPIVKLFFKGHDYAVLTRFLERRGSIETLCRRIEVVTAEHDRAAKDAVGSGSGDNPATNLDSGGST